MSFHQNMTFRYRPSLFRVLVNLMWSVVFLFFGIIMLLFGILGGGGMEWWLRIAMAIFGPVLIYYALVNYLVGSFLSFIEFDGKVIRFRNVKTTYTIPLNQIMKINTSSRKGKLEKISFIIAAGGNAYFDTDIYSKSAGWKISERISVLFQQPLDSIPVSGSPVPKLVVTDSQGKVSTFSPTDLHVGVDPGIEALERAKANGTAICTKCYRDADPNTRYCPNCGGQIKNFGQQF